MTKRLKNMSMYLFYAVVALAAVLFLNKLLFWGNTSFAEVSYDGEWSGTTNQGYDMSYIVNGNRITSLTFEKKVTGSVCSLTPSGTLGFTPGHPISEGIFSFRVSAPFGASDYDEYTGTFTSPSVANGSWKSYDEYCQGLSSGTWEAAKVGVSLLLPPVMTYESNGVDVSIFWPEVPRAKGYELYYAPYPYSGSDSVESIDVGENTRLQYTLWEGAAYYIAVKAYNGLESSPYSNIETLIIPYTTAPESPQLSYNLNGTNLSVTWGSVPGATGYKLYYTLSAYTGQEAFLPLGVGNVTSFSTAGLRVGQAYSIAVVAYNDFGESNFSNVAQFTVEVSDKDFGSCILTESTGDFLTQICWESDFYDWRDICLNSPGYSPSSLPCSSSINSFGYCETTDVDGSNRIYYGESGYGQIYRDTISQLCKDSEATTWHWQ